MLSTDPIERIYKDMKFTINKEAFLIPLQHLVSIIEKKQTMPILANIKMLASEQCLTMIATDLEIQLIFKLDIKIEQPGEITIPARKLFDICRYLPDESNITLEQNEKKAFLTSGKSRFNLALLDANDYPEFNEKESVIEFDIKPELVKSAVEKTIFCMGSQDVRFYLNGLMLNIVDNELLLVASDGHRLSQYREMLEVDSSIDEKIIIPRKCISEVNRLLNMDINKLSIAFSRHNIRFFNETFQFSAKLIDANYPDFSKIFMLENKIVLELPKENFRSSLLRVAILSNEKNKGIQFEFKKDELILTAQNPEREQAEEIITIEYDNKPIQIALNSEYIIEAVSNIDSEKVRLTFSDNASSCIIEDIENNHYQFVVMPIRI